jgi:hypothetical protein
VVAFHLFRVVMVNMGTQYFYAGAAWMFDRIRANSGAPKK